MTRKREKQPLLQHRRVSKWSKRKLRKALEKRKGRTIDHIAKRFGIDASSLYRAIKNGKGKP